MTCDRTYLVRVRPPQDSNKRKTTLRSHEPESSNAGSAGLMVSNITEGESTLNQDIIDESIFSFMSTGIVAQLKL